MKYIFSIATVLFSFYIIGCGENASNNVDDNNQTNPIVIDINDSIIEVNQAEPAVAVYETNNTLYNTRNIIPVTLDFKSTTAQNNNAAYITSQCYTKTLDEHNVVHNPCFSCHINSKEPNYVDDWNLQEIAAFSEYSKVNRFTNLFKDRTSIVSEISDEEILSYVRENNYIQKGQILLANTLKNPPQEWDINNDGTWDGYMPDCYFTFDNEGFDKSTDGDYTGWRAFGYYPFLGTFWPTNGSTDDVLIRLSSEFRENKNGDFDLEVYKLNLAIIESLIKQKNVTITVTDEKKYGVDLNQDGTLGETQEIVYKWVKPTYNSSTGKITNFSMSYVGYAKELLANNEYLIAPGLYPKNTEFLHSVRYIDIDEDTQTIKMASRMKELRYAKKLYWITYSQLSNATLADIKEKENFPDRLRTIVGNTEYGSSNNLGWVYQGFIEDAKGGTSPSKL